MKCPFCAEEIQDEAILCRYCSATKVEGTWVAPGRPRTQPPGSLTLRISGALFLISALFELGAVTDAVPLFGAVHEGAIAWIYHALYIVGFSAMGVGLQRLSSWAPVVVYAGTAFYALDKLGYAISSSTRAADIAYQGRAHGSLMQLVDVSMLETVAQLTAALTAASVIGFAGYVYVRRASFAPRR